MNARLDKILKGYAKTGEFTQNSLNVAARDIDRELRVVATGLRALVQVLLLILLTLLVLPIAILFGPIVKPWVSSYLARKKAER